MSDLPTRVAALPAGYAALLERLTTVLQRDVRVRAAWVHGSVARGEADLASDLDVIVAVEPEALVAFGEDWRARIDAITPTVMARRFPWPGGSMLTITPAGERLDIWVESVANITSSPVRDRLVIFDRDGLADRVPPAEPPAMRSDAKLATLREWYASVRAVAEVADPLLMREVVHVLRWILYEAYVETNRPLPYASVKRWSAKLTAAQAATMESLPTAGDPAPLFSALDAVLGRPEPPLPKADLARAVFPPEGTVRALDLANETAEARARHIAEEFLAIHLYLALVVYRQDWLLGLEGGALLRKLCYELCLEENGRLSASSPADWSGRLRDEQREELLALPTGRATRDDVVAAAITTRDAFCRRGRRVLGARWPIEMERAVLRYVDAHI